MAPRSIEHAGTIRSMQNDTFALGLHAKVTSDVYLDVPAEECSAPDLAILREDARRDGERFGARTSS